MDAWVTSAVKDDAVNKALMLAGSLRRVCTSRKLVVFTSPAVQKTLRKKLQLRFDLVVVLEQDTPNDWNLEEYAKVAGFSLTVFNKCVYLSPNSLVLKNCDEIFEKYGDFAALGNDDGMDSSIYLFTPSLRNCQELETLLKSVELNRNDNSHPSKKTCDIAGCFNLWIQKNFPNCEQLDGEYNILINLDNGIPTSLEPIMTIVNFGSAHPLDLTTTGNFSKLAELGTVEEFVIQLCGRIYSEYVQQETNQVNSDLKFHTEVYKTEPIAIVGMSFRLPGCNNVETFWNLLDNGKEAITALPSFRWKHTHLPFEDQDRKVEGGFLTIPVDEFDAKFFGISGKEVELLDPQQRLLHEVAWEALEDAMIDPHSLRGTQTGVFVGSWLDGHIDMMRRAVDADFFRVYMGNSIGTGAARLSHFLEVTGPSIATESGCSSSIVAVNMACQSLRHRNSNLALACGVNLILKPFDNGSFNFVVAPDGRCKTFDEGANGFGRAEGCAILVMKRFSDAVRDGDSIWGLIRGSAITQEGLSNSLGTPTVHCESLAMELALKDADVDPLAVSYVEAHGTGTPVGDPLEIAAITKVYSKGRTEPLVIGSVKTNVGHTESVSGITGIIKVLLAMKNEIIPKHLNLKRLNPAINLDVIPAIIPVEPIAWPKLANQPRIAGISSFGITGTDGHVILQEPPNLTLPKPNDNVERPLHILKISAKSPQSFQKLLETYEGMFISKGNDDGFAELAYTANAGRATFNHRAVIVAKDFKDAYNVLRNKSFICADVQSIRGQLCFLFTGQGSQYPNMAATLFNTSPIFRDTFNKCDLFLTQQYDINLKQVLWGKSDDVAELSRTIYSQTSIFCIEYCLLKLWESWGVKPDYVMGHSLGEFAAAVAAGVLSFEDALLLVAERSRLIDGLPRGKMLVVKANKETTDELIEDFKKMKPNFWVDYAALNSSSQTVVAGDCSHIEEFSKYGEEKAIKTTLLAATHAFHSRHMDPMLDAYRRVAERVRPFKIYADKDAPKYISGMEGRLMNPELIDADYWMRHTRDPVNFIGACKATKAGGCSIFLEVGPHPVLSALTMVNYVGQPIICLPSIRRKEDEWVTLLGSLAKLYVSEWKGDINWKGFDRYYRRSRVTIPFYPFDRAPFWKEIEEEQPTVHPLLGKSVPNDCDHSIFESRLTLKNTSFIQDHVIGDLAVFPGAAFLEMCLAGGYLTSQNTTGKLKMPQRPIALHSLKITTPLAFEDLKICRLHTSSKLAVEIIDEICYDIKISRFVNSSASGGAGEWITHATALFFPVPPTLRNNLCSTADIDIPTIQKSWRKVDTAGFYERLPQVGLRFGPKFQSLTSGWENEMGAFFTIKVPAESLKNFLIHPVLADAMIQAILLWTTKDRFNIKLQVPVQIGEFLWLKPSTSPNCYIYCTTNETGKIDCILLDEGRNHLAQISSVDFIQTSVELIEEKIQQLASSMPKMWQEVWKSIPGALQSAYDLKQTFHLPLLQLNEEQRQFFEDTNNIPEREKRSYTNICKLVQLYFINAMYEVGWKPTEMTPFTLEELIQLLPKPKKHFRQYIKFFLKLIADTGLVFRDPGQEDKYYFGSMPPSQDDIHKGLQNITDIEDQTRVDYQLAVEVGRKLSQILLGNIEALPIIFTEDPDKPNASQYYSFCILPLVPIFRKLNRELILPMFSACCTNHGRNDEALSSSPVLRILEVGAGTGGSTKNFLEQLEEWGKPFEYHFTDISTSFLNAAREKFCKYSKQMTFRKFNMEEDALSQGLGPEYFDIIAAFEVLHVAKDIRKTLRNLKVLLKPGGLLYICETAVTEPVITQTFGLLEGYWQFKDFDLRPSHITLTPKKWEQVLKEINCDKVILTPARNSIHTIIVARLSHREQDDPPTTIPSLINCIEDPQFAWIILYNESNVYFAELLKNYLAGVHRKVYAIKRPTECTEGGVKELVNAELVLTLEEKLTLEGVIYLWGLENHINNRDQSQISLPLVSLMQKLIKCKITPRLYVVTQGAVHVDGFEVTNPASGTLHGIIKSFINEYFSLNLNFLDLCPDESAANQVGKVFQELWFADQPKKYIAYRNNNRLFCKLVSAKVNNYEPLPLPTGCARFKLRLPASRVISDLEFEVLENYTLEKNEVEVQVKAVGLNFRDVFAVLKPIKQLEECNTIGADFSGVIIRVGSRVARWNVGDRVLGINMENDVAMPSHIRIEESFLLPIPTSVTLQEGATIPIVFLTTFNCLIKIAKMTAEDTVLIHTASGGVGLCAIQLAKHVGANVIATAGSQRKQNYLRNIGIKHVFNSRTTQFGQQVLEVTNGRGVDIVLNSITGDGMKEASLAALAPNGRFIEMSKLNVWRPDEVKEIRPDVEYQIVDLMSGERSSHIELLETLNEFLHSNYIHPLPYERFDAVNIRGALNYMQKAKHIGKIICVMPEIKIQNSKVAWATPLLNECSTYLVTGGLGGIGFEVVTWMLNSGAKHIAIASRSSPKPEIANQIELWNKSGKHVEAFSGDIGDYNHCQQLFKKLHSPDRGFPQLRGIMHVAGVLADATLENQTWSKFRITYNSKVDGTWHLHDLTKDLQLEHFVMFSSISASIGSPGQSNHAASNSFEDSLAACRRSNGLPATTINWGNWGEIGIATEVDFPGIHPITTYQGILALEAILKTQTPQMVVLNASSFSQTTKLFPWLKGYVDDKSLFSDQKTTHIINGHQFWKDVENAQDCEMKLFSFKQLIKSTLKTILKVEQTEDINEFMNFQTLGIDSLMVLELMNGLQNILGDRMKLNANQLKEYSNTEELANLLVDILEGESVPHNKKLLTVEELQRLVREDSILPQNVRPSKGMCSTDVSKIDTVFLTGSTGTLGPYILRELSHMPTIKKIYCLVRERKQASPSERLLKRLQDEILEKQVDLTKVECIQGDIALNRFGLSEEVYNRLATEVNGIFNCAVKADHVSGYHKATETSNSDLQTVNVKGTIHILEFAVHKQLKFVYHASSLLAVTTASGDGYISEDWQDVDAFDQFSYNFGYPISKHIGEQLCKQAVERGIPCKVFRHPGIGGNSETGRIEYLTNHLLLRQLTFLKLKCMPETPIPMVVMSVDTCAKISLDVFFNPKAPLDIYNIAQKKTGMERDIITVAKEFGIEIELVSFEEFLKKLKLLKNSPLSPFLTIYDNENEGVVVAMQREYENPTKDYIKAYFENATEFYQSRKLPLVIDNYDELVSTEQVIKRDMLFLKESGVFDKFGIM